LIRSELQGLGVLASLSEAEAENQKNREKTKEITRKRLEPIRKTPALMKVANYYQSKEDVERKGPIKEKGNSRGLEVHQSIHLLF